jgi:UDP:flavonoid glycosyltransferase YjiC (YdhE family)
MKFLLMPGNNSLSHVAKCLAIKEALVDRGHDALVAVSEKSSRFLQKQNIAHHVLPDIQENDGAGMPTVEWFRDHLGIIDCINAEVALLKEYKPDRVLGVFRFTVKASARIADIPYDSLTCGCMTPDSQEVLGFVDGERGRESQQIILNGFYRYAAIKTSMALASFGLDAVSDVRYMLKGERTFLWDIPEFFPLSRKPDIIYIGPITWNHWQYDRMDIGTIVDGNLPLAIIAFGTCMAQASSAKRIIKILLELGYKVLVAAGGQKEFLNIMPDDPRVIVHTFAPLHKLTPHASLLICHGGQMTVFEALQNKTPVIVMPFQPEQAHNGVCLERIGCGRRLVPPQLFQGNSGVYIDALNSMTDDKIKSAMTGLVNNLQRTKRLAEIKEALGQYKGAEKLAMMLEVG